MKLKIHHNSKYFGEINILGAKNSAVAIIPATILLEGKTTLYNIPNIKDIKIIISVLSELGLKVFFENNTLTIEGSANTSIITNKEVQSLRASYYFYSALLSKFNHICSYLPGGCDLGSRPINFHLDGFNKLGCDFITFDNYIEIVTNKLISNTINLPFPSVGATINLIILASKINGTTIINNASIEPEVLDLINFLTLAGANITVLPNKIIIIGVNKLSAIKYKIIPDRIEAGSYMLLGLLKPFKGITVNNINYKHLSKVIEVIKKIGGKLVMTKNKITIFPPNEIVPQTISSEIYPGFPTDLIQILSVVLASSSEKSKITDTIFSNRYKYLTELKKLNIDVVFNQSHYLISSKELNNTATMVCSDLRGAFALFASCFLTEGVYYLENIDYIFRGYNNFLEILKLLKINFEFN